MAKYVINVVRSNADLGDDLQLFLKEFMFSLDGCGHQEGICPNNPCDDRINTDFEIIYVLGGSNEIFIEGKSYYGKAGDLFLIPPFTRHYIHTTDQDPHNNYWLHFDIEPYYARESFIRAITSDSQEYCVHIGYHQDLADLFANLLRELETMEPGYKTIVNLQLLHIITLLIRKNIGRAEDASGFSYVDSAKQKIVRNAIDYIEKNLGRNLLIGELSDVLHISESYLYKCFSCVINITPNVLIQMLRAKKAKLLIETSDIRFSEIAECLGFSSYYYFSAFFKKMYGISPKDYKNNQHLLKNTL